MHKDVVIGSILFFIYLMFAGYLGSNFGQSDLLPAIIISSLLFAFFGIKIIKNRARKEMFDLLYGKSKR